jgi:peptidyl-prolyl cis-trans isomerase B (cyclophilin B)
MGGPGYCIKGEFTANGFENNLSHNPGVISMARQANPMDSAGSQFFICTSDCYYLDGQYAGFGMVTSGLDVAYAIAKEGNQYNSTPAEPIIIESITIDEKGGDYSVVEKLEEK